MIRIFDAPATYRMKEGDMGNDRIMQEWANIPERLRRRWRKLTNEDVRRADGNAQYLAEVLQERYGVDRREAFLQVYEFESEL